VRRFVVFVLVSFVLTGAASGVAQAPPVVLRSPVDAPVLDPFRAPTIRFGEGNRGVEYDTDAGVVVDAAGPGIVVFAAPVAGQVWVSIDHGAGLRTSYGPLAGLRVRRGDIVERGDAIATTTGPFHFGARIDDVYVDPAGLMGVYEFTVRLVAHETEDPRRWLQIAAHEERLQLLDAHRVQSVGFFGSVFGRLRGAMGGLADGIGNGDPALCSAPSAIASARRPQPRRIAVLVDGLGSSSSDGEALSGLDLVGLGYGAADIVRHSYVGGLVPGGGDGWGIERSTYDGGATRGPIESQVAELSRTLRAISAANPGVAIDVYGHSLGGVVARHALVAVHGEVEIGIAVTLASPHAGVPLARLAVAIEGTSAGAVAGLVSADWSGAELAAPVIVDLTESGFAGRFRHVGFPDDVHAVTIGARADVVVPALLADAPGARHVVVGGSDPIDAHGGIAALPEVETEVRLALAGLPPACSGVADRILDLVVPGAIAFGHNAAVLGTLGAGLLGR